MLLCAVGDVHGKFRQMYRIVEELEEQIGQEVDLVVQVGDLGVWPDPRRVDAATRRHGGAYDAPGWFAACTASPRPTVFIAGNHDDFEFLMGFGHGGAREGGPTDEADGGPLLDALRIWRKEALQGIDPGSIRRRQLLRALPRAKRPRQLLTRVLDRDDLKALLGEYRARGVTIEKLKRWFRSAPDPKELREQLD